MLFIYPYKTFFLLFYDIMVYILNVLSAMKKIAIKELTDFKYENYYRRIGYTKENRYYSKKRQKKNLLSVDTKLI